MPLILNDNPNPQAVMLGRQHLRKIMLGGDIVWQKRRRRISLEDLSLETLEHRGIKLKAANQNGSLYLPMFFPHRKRSDWVLYRDRLTFIADTELSLQTIDAMLEADVVDWDMLFPMCFFDGKPSEEYRYQHKLTFIGKEEFLLALESIDGLLVADVQHDNEIVYPMAFPASRPKSRPEYLDKLTFIPKEVSALTLESMDSLLVSDVGNDRNIQYPMSFHDHQPEIEYNYRHKLTFIAKEEVAASSTTP